MSGEKTEIRDSRYTQTHRTEITGVTHRHTHHKSEASTQPSAGWVPVEEREANNNTYTKVIHTANYTCLTLKLHALYNQTT